MRMSDPKRIGMLARVAGIRKEADLTMLAAADLRLRSLRARLEALDLAVADARAAAAAAADPLSLAALDRFAHWSAQQKVDLAESLRDAERQVAEARNRARLSFGRADALTRLAAGAGITRHPET